LPQAEDFFVIGDGHGLDCATHRRLLMLQSNHLKFQVPESKLQRGTRVEVKERRQVNRLFCNWDATTAIRRDAELDGPEARSTVAFLCA
jgi:hypothetical protein